MSTLCHHAGKRATRLLTTMGIEQDDPNLHRRIDIPGTSLLPAACPQSVWNWAK